MSATSVDTRDLFMGEGEKETKEEYEKTTLIRLGKGAFYVLTIYFRRTAPFPALNAKSQKP